MYNFRFIIKFLFFIFAFFLIAESVSALTITSSPETVSITATVGGSVSPIDDTDGGGGGYFLTSVTFSGHAYPNASVHVLKDGVPKGTTVANASGYFSITFFELYNPTVLYTLYAIDTTGRHSLLLNYPVVVKRGYVTQISGIRFAPTIAIDKTEVRVGDYLTVFGHAIPNASIDLTLEGAGSQRMKFSLVSGSDGTYKITAPLSILKKGAYTVFVNYTGDNRVSKVLRFTIGEANILSVELTTNIPGDCNADQIINIVDFSIAAFWYHKPNPPKCIDTNNDKIINLVDFSILAFYWTG